MLASVKSFCVTNPATVTLTGVNLFFHVLLHYLPKRKLDMDSVNVTGETVFDNKEYRRIFLSLFCHADDSHLMYNLLHMWMYLPFLENTLIVAEKSSQNTSVEIIAKKIAFTSSLYLGVGAAGVLFFLKAIERKYKLLAESTNNEGIFFAAKYIPLIGNSPAAYGLHAFSMILASSSHIFVRRRNDQNELTSSGRWSVVLFSLITSVPTFLSNWEKQNQKLQVDLRKFSRRGESTSSSSLSSLPSSVSPIERLKVLGLSATFGAFHYALFSLPILLRGPNLYPPVILSFFAYVGVRRFSLPFFSKCSKRFLFSKNVIQEEDNNNNYQEEMSSDDHLSHFGGAVCGVLSAIGTMLLFASRNNKSLKQQIFDPSQLWLPAVVMLELGSCAYSQYKN
jgi:membrane associated rhomboid family serine protease